MNTVKARGVGRTSWRMVAVVTVVGLLGFAPVTANASDGVDEAGGAVQMFSDTQCVSGNFCLWSSASYLGTFTSVSGTATSAVSTRASGSRSVWNRTGKAVRVHSGTGGTGSSACYGAGTKLPDIDITSRSVVVQSGSSC